MKERTNEQANYYKREKIGKAPPYTDFLKNQAEEAGLRKD